MSGRGHNEPIVRRPFAQGFDRVYSHITDTADPRVHNAPPILDWWVNKSFDELEAMQPPCKTSLVSGIASTKVDIPGHQKRNAFIDAVEKNGFPTLTFLERVGNDSWTTSGRGLLPTATPLPSKTARCLTIGQRKSPTAFSPSLSRSTLAQRTSTTTSRETP